MNPIKFEGATIVGAPKDWDPEKDGECIGLPAQISIHPNGMRLITSVWKFTDEERRAIASGQNLALSCVGAQVPIILSVSDIDGPIVPFSRDEPELEPATELQIRAAFVDVMANNLDKVEQAKERKTARGWFVGTTINTLKDRGLKVRDVASVQRIVAEVFEIPQPVAASET
jgi:hypothetical protein